MKNRVIPLQGVKNIRDLGGLETEDGREVRSQCLLRSSTLSGLTQSREK